MLSAAAERAAATDPELAVTMLAQAVDAALFAAAPAEMLRAARRARELLPPNASAQAEFLVTSAEGMAFIFGGKGERGIEAFRRSVELAESSEELRTDPRLLSWLVMGPLWLREADAGRALVQTALETARAQAALGVLPSLLERVARDHAAATEWATAEVEFDEAIRLARETGQRTQLVAALAGLAWLEARQGREQACRAHAAEARALSADLGIWLYETWAIRALGELELALGRTAEAALLLEEETARHRQLGIGDVDTSPAAELVEAYLRLGRPEDAAVKADELEGQAREKGQPWSLARMARARGLLAEDEELDAPFEEALRLHERTPDAFEAARTRLAYGGRLRRARRRVQAKLDARPWAERARVELAATGETLRRRDPSSLDELTPQELQIGMLLAGGKTTREAAAALFLSPKTVEYHLRHVYRKLGVGSRPELAVRLAALRETGEA